MKVNAPLILHCIFHQLGFELTQVIEFHQHVDDLSLPNKVGTDLIHLEVDGATSCQEQLIAKLFHSRTSA